MPEQLSFVEQHAANRSMPVCAVNTFELLRAASGNPIVVSLLDGTEILLRLATVDEAIQFQIDGVAALPPAVRPSELMTRERAAELVAPVGGGRRG